jgi:hypothetical protein
MDEQAMQELRRRLLEKALEGETPHLDAQGILTDPLQLRDVSHLVAEVMYDFLANPFFRPMLEEATLMILHAFHDLICNDEQQKVEEHTWEPSKPLMP